MAVLLYDKKQVQGVAYPIFKSMENNGHLNLYVSECYARQSAEIKLISEEHDYRMLTFRSGKENFP